MGCILSRIVDFTPEGTAAMKTLTLIAATVLIATTAAASAYDREDRIDARRAEPSRPIASPTTATPAS